jgi:hypothetical protein
LAVARFSQFLAELHTLHMAATQKGLRNARETSGRLAAVPGKSDPAAPGMLDSAVPGTSDAAWLDSWAAD